MKYRDFELLVVAFSPGLDLLWLSCNPGIIVYEVYPLGGTFIGDVCFRFLPAYGVSSVFVLLIDWRKVKAFFGLVGTEAAISSSDWVSGYGVTGLMRAISSISMVCNSNRDSNRNFNRDSGRLYL